MKLFRTSEEPPRLVVVCRDENEHRGLRGAADLYEIRTRQSDRITGGTGNTANQVAGLKMDLAVTTVRFALSNATGKEYVVVTEAEKQGTLLDVAYNAADELDAERKVRSGITAGVWGADALPARNPHYGGEALNYWRDQAAEFARSLGALPVLEFAPAQEPTASQV